MAAKSESMPVASADSVATVQRKLPGSGYELKCTLQGHKRGVSCVKISDDGRWVASGSADKTIIIWSLETGDMERILEGHEEGVNDVAWARGAQFVASASDDTTVRLWDTHSGHVLKILREHTNYVFCVCFNPQGTLLASGSFDESVRLWNVKTGQCLKVLPAHADPISAVNFNKDGSLLVTGSYDGLCRIWDSSTGQCFKTLIDNDNPPVSSVKFSPNGKYILVSTLDGAVRLWQCTTGKCLKLYRSHKNTKYCICANFSTTGEQQFVVSGSEDNGIYLWDLQTNQVVDILTGHGDVVVGTDCHPTENLIVSCSLEKDPVIKVWHAPHTAKAMLDADDSGQKSSTKAAPSAEAQKGDVDKAASSASA
eukprot:m.51583 g.51583  ORF g.51583 m.51583 type:complete len:368 (-) comp11246_c0_seq2:272-1375(-)